MLGCLLALAQDMTDKSVAVSLETQQKRLLRRWRRGDTDDRKAGQDFLAQSAKRVQRMQANAKLDDKARTTFKFWRGLEDQVKKMRPKKRRRLDVPPALADVALPGQPPLAVASAAGKPDGAALGAYPETPPSPRPSLAVASACGSILVR